MCIYKDVHMCVHVHIYAYAWIYAYVYIYIYVATIRRFYEVLFLMNLGASTCLFHEHFLEIENEKN